MMTERPSPNFDGRPADTPIDMLVFHYTGMETAEAALERLCDPASKVSAHYVIGEDGVLTSLVAEDRRAWHAGAAFWRGETDINGRSIGVELVNPGHEFGYRDYPERQMRALEDLAHDILSRHPIPARNIVGHSDVAPARKQDPGERFDWRRLASAGIGLWPGEAETEDGKPAGKRPAEENAADLLAAIGYEVTDLQAAISAFQRRFRQARIDGDADKETLGLMAALLAS